MKNYDLKMDCIYDALFPFGSSMASGMRVNEIKLTYTNIDYWDRGMYCNLYHLVEEI